MKKEDIKNMAALMSEEYIKYKIGETIWHKTNSEIGAGVIVNWRVYGEDGTYDYLVSFGPGQTFQMSEEEVTLDKPIQV